MNKYIDALVNYIKSNPNWKIDLKKAPYSLKTIKECTWHSNWYMFVYNLFDSDLTNDVVRGCRGTVLEIDNDVKIVSAPYTKFFGYGDPSGKDIENSINWNTAQIQSKIDGIIIKTACVEENEEKRLYFFTNGSFDLNAPLDGNFVYDEKETRNAKTYGDLLKYALIKADSSVKINFNEEIGYFYITGGWSDNIPLGSTIMMELTSPRNQIVCEYEETKLWVHGYRDPNLNEINPRELNFFPFDMPKLYNAHSFDEVRNILKDFKGKEEEGVVVVDYNTVGTPRAKIKCDDYLRLKFARDTSNNSQVLFKAVVDNEYDDIVSAVPATLSKVEEIKKNIETLKKWFISQSFNIKNFETKKDYVMWVRATTKKDLFSYYMAMYNENVDNKFDRMMEVLSVKKHGYDELLKIMEEI